jgi:two-component system, LytTR family, sensor kinase
MTKTKIYWLCQMVAWSIFTATSVVMKSFSEDFSLSLELVGRLTIMAFGIGATHLQKLMFSHFSVSSFKALKLATTIFCSALLTTSVMIIGAFSILSPLLASLGREENLFTIEVLFGNIVAFGLIILVWNALYFGVNGLLNWQMLAKDKVELEHALKEAKLNSLIGQINPHFLFNSLNNIRALILEDGEKARDAIAKLSNLLRQTLTTDFNQSISLTKELKTVTNFIEIVRIQLEDRLDYQQTIDLDPEQVLLPPMTVQMLIENAVKHGISEVRGGGVLKCRIYLERDNVIIEVTNPGNLNHDSIEKQANSTGLGVKNIQQRLMLLFGDRAEFSLTEHNNLVTAKLAIPQNQTYHTTEACL